MHPDKCALCYLKYTCSNHGLFWGATVSPGGMRDHCEGAVRGPGADQRVGEKGEYIVTTGKLKNNVQKGVIHR